VSWWHAGVEGVVSGGNPTMPKSSLLALQSTFSPPIDNGKVSESDAEDSRISTSMLQTSNNKFPYMDLPVSSNVFALVNPAEI
jgi:hypothetical protein